MKKMFAPRAESGVERSGDRLCTLREVRADSLVLCIPMNGCYFGPLGPDDAARSQFYDRLEEACQSRNVPLVDYREYEQDPRFFMDTHDHPGAKGWIYLNRTLDVFSTIARCWRHRLIGGGRRYTEERRGDEVSRLPPRSRVSRIAGALLRLLSPSGSGTADSDLPLTYGNKQPASAGRGSSPA